MCFQVLRTKYAYMCILESFGAVFVHQMDCICLEQTHGKEKNVAAHTWEQTAWAEIVCVLWLNDAKNIYVCKCNGKAKKHGSKPTCKVEEKHTAWAENWCVLWLK
ncbi:hypothetical protein DVH24_034261 [Malus domestica]|uniref:Uncharacterized protein n=1 Tax=Malus domestica TaxID=3750 RepID=A0A498J1N1_MALDO|nr:hypothetical protein DVH24_034261 [Malus domestica]